MINDSGILQESEKKRQSFQEVEVGQLCTMWEKNKIGLLIHTMHKNQPQVDMKSNMRQIIKLFND